MNGENYFKYCIQSMFLIAAYAYSKCPMLCFHTFCVYAERGVAAWGLGCSVL